MDNQRQRAQEPDGTQPRCRFEAAAAAGRRVCEAEKREKPLLSGLLFRSGLSVTSDVG
jgi:hypothetical protein